MYALKKGYQPMIKELLDVLTVKHLDLIITYSIRYRMSRNAKSKEEQ